VPIATVSHKASAPREALRRLRETLPVLVAEAVACPEEPYDGDLRAGDVNLRFLAALSEEEALDYVIEVRTRWTETRSTSLDERAERVRAGLSDVGLERFGVWIETPAAGWAQDA
jgi:hypothetical protein